MEVQTETLESVISKAQNKRLERSFLERSTDLVAPDLLGKIIKRAYGKQTLSALITEVEAYRGADDPASHAARGQTKRNQLMFGPAGFSYVYFIYGRHNCFNVVTETEGQPGAVLVRSVLLDLVEPVIGPGRTTKKLKLKKSQSGLDLLASDGQLRLVDPGINVPKSQVQNTPRIGIKKGTDKLWRWEWIIT